MERYNYLNYFYENSCDENNRLRSQHGMVEFLTTMSYIKRYLTPGCRIIDIGAGTGRYTEALTEFDCRIDAVEVVRHNYDILQRNIEALPDHRRERASASLGDALDLSAFPDETFDITLIMGPLYHLWTKELRLQALSEAVRVTKAGGVLFSAFCGNDACVAQFVFRGNGINDPKIRSLIELDTFRCLDSEEEVIMLSRREDIDDLMSGFPLSRLHFVGTDMMANYMRDTMDTMDDDTFKLFMKWHMLICERRDCVGLSNHFLDIERKL